MRSPGRRRQPLALTLALSLMGAGALLVRVTPRPATLPGATPALSVRSPEGAPDLPEAGAPLLSASSASSASSPPPADVVDEGDGTAALVDGQGVVVARWAISTAVTWDNGDGTATTVDTAGDTTIWPIVAGPAVAAAVSLGPATASADSHLQWPIVGRITTPYGPRHQGIDIACRPGVPIAAAGAGKVASAGWDSTGYGNRVVVDHDAGAAPASLPAQPRSGDTVPGAIPASPGLRTTYNHLSALAVRAGQAIAVGQTVGLCGATGWATGPHLHFETLVRGQAVNPASVLAPLPRPG